MQLILNLIPWKQLTLTVFRNLWVRKIQRKKRPQNSTNICMWVYCQKLHTKVPGLVRVGEEKTNCDWKDLKSRGSLIYPSKDLLEEVEKYEKIFQKIHGESLDRGHAPIEKTISTITVINQRWPREVVKLFVNVRFFSKLKKLNLSLKENSKKKCQNIETNC